MLNMGFGNACRDFEILSEDEYDELMQKADEEKVFEEEIMEISNDDSVMLRN